MDSSDVVLVFPEVFKYGVVSRRHRIPLSCLTIGSYIKDYGYSSTIIDTAVSERPIERLIKIVKRRDLVVGFSVTTNQQILSGLEICRVIKDENPNITTVWGGPVPTGIPDVTVRDGCIDIVVRGEGEKTFLDLVSKIEKQRSLGGIKGITYIKDGKIRTNPAREMMDLRELPLVDYKPIYEHIDKYDGWNTIETSRGCPFNCKFCGTPNFCGRRWRKRPIDDVIEEIKYLLDFTGNRKIRVCDSNPWIGKHFEEFSKGIKNEGIDAEFESFHYVNACSREQVESMKKTGFIGLVFGIESGSNRILRSLNKNYTSNQVLELASYLSKTGLSAHFGFMMGFPREKLEDLWKTVDLMNKVRANYEEIVLVGPEVYLPLPMSEFYEDCLDLGWVPPNDLESWGRFQAIDRIKDPFLKAVYFSGYLMNTRWGLIKDSKGLMRITLQILKGMESLRWRRKFFKFPLELKLIELLQESIKAKSAAV